MSLQEKINEDLKTALKAGDSFVVESLRTVNAVLQNKSIEKRGKGEKEELDDEEVTAILNKEVKKRKEAAALYKQGNRPELAEKEEQETKIIQKYLPEQLSRAEIKKKIEEILGKTKLADFGAVMKEVMKELRGRADAQMISEILKEELEK